MTVPRQPSVDAEGTSRARDLVVAASADFTARLARANSGVLALRSSWTGAAATDFSEAMQEWERHVTTVIDELNQVADSLRAGT